MEVFMEVMFLILVLLVRKSFLYLRAVTDSSSFFYFHCIEQVNSAFAAVANTAALRLSPFQEYP